MEQNENRRFMILNHSGAIALAILPCLLLLAGCASTPQIPGPSPLSSEERQEAENIESAEADGCLSPIEADLQKDALQHNIKF